MRQSLEINEKMYLKTFSDDVSAALEATVFHLSAR
jgi:hypothetical protein